MNQCIANIEVELKKKSRTTKTRTTKTKKKLIKKYILV